MESDKSLSKNSLTPLVQIRLPFAVSALILPVVMALYPLEVRALSATDLTPIDLSNRATQNALPQFVPTDVTPYTVAPERNLFNRGYKFRLFQMLPERFWFTSTTEFSQRLDTNVLFTSSNPKPDYALRAMPNITAGYNILKNTSIYTNYFALKDSFAAHSYLNLPATQSLAWGIRHNKRLAEKTDLQFDLQARELWQGTNVHQFDFLPGITVTRRLSPKDIAFASALLQLRGAHYFVAPTREMDPFYTVGYMHRQGIWTFSCTDTLATNYRNPLFNDAIPHQSNVSMISDIEINRPVSKRYSSLVAFARAEPVLNWGAHNTPGLSGFDFRLFTGLRFTMNKPSYYAAMDRMRQQILAQNKEGKTDRSSAPAQQGSPVNAGDCAEKSTSSASGAARDKPAPRSNLSLAPIATTLSFNEFAEPINK